MKAYEVLSRRVERTGISVSELARRTNIDHMALRNALHGKRNVRAEELIVLSRELDLNFDDFADVA